MDNSNIKLLSVYYSTEKFFKNGLASPLISSIRPVIGVQEHSYSLIVDKALPNLVKNVNPDKLAALLCKRFAKINTGQIPSKIIVGNELSADKIVEQTKMHDTFNTLFRKYFDELKMQRFEIAETAHTNVMVEINALNKRINIREMQMLRKMFASQPGRSPLSMDQDILLEIIDIMHAVTAILSTTAIADSVLSQAVIQTTKVTSAFDAEIFL